jgi:hypothetical protein
LAPILFVLLGSIASAGQWYRERKPKAIAALRAAGIQG